MLGLVGACSVYFVLREIQDYFYRKTICSDFFHSNSFRGAQNGCQWTELKTLRSFFFKKIMTGYRAIFKHGINDSIIILHSWQSYFLLELQKSSSLPWPCFTEKLLMAMYVFTILENNMGHHDNLYDTLKISDLNRCSEGSFDYKCSTAQSGNKPLQLFFIWQVLVTRNSDNCTLQHHQAYR